jgi:hypothetical protein
MTGGEGDLDIAMAPSSERPENDRLEAPAEDTLAMVAALSNLIEEYE